MKNICSYKSISAQHNWKTVFEDFSFSVNSGEFWVVAGKNGSGKSLIGQLLTKSLNITNGEFSHPQSVGYVSSINADFILSEDKLNEMGDPENLTDPGQRSEEFILSGLDVEKIPQELIEKLSIAGILHRGIRQLSTGELQKLMICKAILQNPSVIIFDDPYEGLDVNSRQNLSNIINQIDTTKIAVILIVSRLESVLDGATHIAFMDGQNFAVSGKKEEIINSQTLKTFFDPSIKMPKELPAHPTKIEVNCDEEGNIISLKNSSVNYGERKVFDKFNWQVKKGENWIITGPNGCGKTTLLSLITGDHAQSYNNGLTLFGIKRGSGETIWDIKKNIGIVSSALQRDYKVSVSVIDTVISGFYDTIGIYTKYTQEQYKIAEEWLKIIGMIDIKNSSIKTLSYGEQRLLLIVRAMVKFPPVLILDEPCLGLDPINRALILRLINFLAEKSPTQIFYVTHHEEDKIDCINNRITFTPLGSEKFDIKISHSF